MKIEEIPAHEADFDANHMDSNEKIFAYTIESIPVPGEASKMDYVNLLILVPRRTFCLSDYDNSDCQVTDLLISGCQTNQNPYSDYMKKGFIF